MANFWKNKSRTNPSPTGSYNPTHHSAPVGSVRQNQLITSFGVGSIIDFVSDTVMIAGTDDWDNSEPHRIYNENLQGLTGSEYFVRPKSDTKSSISHPKSKDIPAYLFPETLWCTECKHLIDIRSLQHQKDPHKCIYCNKKTLVASRFVIACQKGHIEDFPYYHWVHKGQVCAANSNQKLKMYNIDNRSGIDSLIIECVHCKAKRPIAGAFSEYSFSGANGYTCKGHYPHLKNPNHYADDQCDYPMKALLRSASNVYFPVSISALSIPPWSKYAVKIVQNDYRNISLGVEDRTPESATTFLRKYFEKYVTPYITQEDLLEAYRLVSTQKINKKRTMQDVYADEYKELCKGNCQEESGDFSTSTAFTPEVFQSLFTKIVVAERLTEVQALYGFTRINPIDGALDGSTIAPLSMKKTNWLPAVELHGEGIFFQFNKNAIDAWSQKSQPRYASLASHFNKSFFENPRFSDGVCAYSSQYILLHSFAHLFMRQVSMDCGYNVASLKEKIYSTFIDNPENPPMAGVLIYLTSSDADGSLGGLTSIAQNSILLKQVIVNALKKAMWCSADPLCITSRAQGYASLNYAACHDCLLVPETSCEFRNILLDRAALIGTEDAPFSGYFSSIINPETS